MLYWKYHQTFATALKCKCYGHLRRLNKNNEMLLARTENENFMRNLQGFAWGAYKVPR